MHDDDVADLVLAAAAGDKAAWDSVVERFSGLVWAVIRSYRLQPQDAADVFQTTWLRGVEQLARVREPERLGGWLATTARREALRVLRMKGREVVTEHDTLDLRTAQNPAPEERLERAERDDVLWECFEAGSSRCQQLLRVLLADPPPSYADVAAGLQIPVGSIGPTRRRCLEHLRHRLAEAGVDVDHS